MGMSDLSRTCRVELSWPGSYFTSGSSDSEHRTGFLLPRCHRKKQYSLCSMSSSVWKGTQQVTQLWINDLSDHKIPQHVLNDIHKPNSVSHHAVWLQSAASLWCLWNLSLLTCALPSPDHLWTSWKPYNPSTLMLVHIYRGSFVSTCCRSSHWMSSFLEVPVQYRAWSREGRDFTVLSVLITVLGKNLSASSRIWFAFSKQLKYRNVMVTVTLT